MRDFLEKTFTILFSVLCFSLAFIGDQFYAVPNGINILLVAIFPFVVNKKDLQDLISKKPIVWFVIFLSFVLIKSILVGQFLDDLFVIKKLFQILLIIILSSGLKVSSLEWLKSGIILGTFVAVFYSLVKITLLIINTASFNFAKGSVINETLPVQRLYLGLLCTISLILVLERFFKKRKKINLFLALTFTVFVFLIAARIAIITIILVLLYYLQLKLHRKFKIIAFFSVLILAFFIISNTPSLSKRVLHSDDQFSDTYFQKIQKHEPRYIIWSHSLSLIDKNHALFGYGFEGYQNKLLKKYEKIPQVKKREWFIQEQFNSHNQFLDILLSQGLFGLIIFLLFFYYLFKESLRSDTKFLLLLSIVMFFMVYNNFHRVIGVFIFALIYSLIVTSNKIVHK
jgi:O-antigen ligase